MAEKPGIEQDEMMAVQMGNHCNYSGGYSSSYDDDPELLTIMEREFGSKQEERDRYSSYRKQTVSTPVRHTTVIKKTNRKGIFTSRRVQYYFCMGRIERTGKGKY